MKKTHRKISLLLAGILCFGMLTACGSSSDTASTDAASVSETTSGEAREELVFVNYRDIRDLNPHLYAGEM